MKTLLTGGTVLQGDGVWASDCPVLWENGKILATGEACGAYVADRTLSAEGLCVLPGLVDVHTHGRSGFDFNTATAEQMRSVKRDYAMRGVTSVFATLASDTAEGWLRSIRAIEESGYEGIHFEGRYLNAGKRGAHAPELLCPLDAADLEAVLQHVHLPCHISAAFELDSDGSFAACARRFGATLGLGHSMATADEARLAISRGVTSFTHLYNCMPQLHHREGGAVCVALNGGGYGELIADGMHICPDMIRLAYRCLGRDKTVLITDSMEATGCADGEYAIAGQPVIVKDGKALTLDGALAGSTLDLWNGVKNLMKFADASLADAVLCATVNPSRMVGIDGEVGSIEAGKRADLLLVDDQLNLCTVIARGEILKEDV